MAFLFSKSKTKTNAMRILDKKKVSYEIHNYEVEDGHIDGLSVAEKIGRNPSQVYKTLVTQGHGGEYFVFVVPVNKEVDLKKAARAVGEKSVAMIPVADIEKVTGYIRGGCSPVGMKKQYVTLFDSTAERQESIIVSGGKIGTQIEVNPLELATVCKGLFADLTEGLYGL